MNVRITWKSQGKSILSKAGKRVEILGRILNELTPYCVNYCICISFARPILEYCDNCVELHVVDKKMPRIWKSCKDVLLGLYQEYTTVTELWN